MPSCQPLSILQIVKQRLFLGYIYLILGKYDNNVGEEYIDIGHWALNISYIYFPI